MSEGMSKVLASINSTDILKDILYKFAPLHAGLPCQLICRAVDCTVLVVQRPCRCRYRAFTQIPGLTTLLSTAAL